MRQQIRQLAPCDPGWRVLRAYRQDGVINKHIDPVLMWALVYRNDDADVHPMYDDSLVKPAVLGECGEIEVVVTDAREFVGLLKPGDDEGAWDERVVAHLDFMDSCAAEARAKKSDKVAMKSSRANVVPFRGRMA